MLRGFMSIGVAQLTPPRLVFRINGASWLYVYRRCSDFPSPLSRETRRRASWLYVYRRYYPSVDWIRWLLMGGNTSWQWANTVKEVARDIKEKPSDE